MGRTKEQQREYMRAYRARKRSDQVVDEVGFQGHKWAATRIAELEEEVRHLKEELAKRPPEPSPKMAVSAEYVATHLHEFLPAEDPYADTSHPFNTRPFTPVPRKRDK